MFVAVWALPSNQHSQFPSYTPSTLHNLYTRPELIVLQSNYYGRSGFDSPQRQWRDFFSSLPRPDPL